ncbi:HNH endonuclease [Myxococcota bacterium]|nr:HNH endonuclease [Myxococcota bacterium]
MDKKELLEKIHGLRVHAKGDTRAPHKPLLLLMALAEIQRGGERLLGYADIEEPLTMLLQSFGRPRPRQEPHLPFWHLMSDGFWDVENRADLEAARGDLKRKKDVPARILRDERARGGFTPEVFDLLNSDRQLVNELVGILLEEHFTDSFQDELLNAVGFEWLPAGRRRRDPKFRETILRIYEDKCAICGFDLRLGVSGLALEAAHVRWHSANGPDDETNGLALCSIHHKALDRGAIGLSEEYRVLVSEQLRGNHEIDHMFLRFSGASLRSPLKGRPHIDLRHIRWHAKEVFKHPAREF